MQENENQEERMEEASTVDPKKAAILIGGVVAVLLAVFTAMYLFTDKTKASSGAGGMAVITPDRIEKISDEVSEQVLDTLGTDILTDLISKSVTEELTEEKIRKIISDTNLELNQPDEELLRGMIDEMLSEAGISGDGLLSEKQKDYIKLTVDKILKQSLSSISITQLLTDEEKRLLVEELKQELSVMLRQQIPDGTYQLTQQDLAKIRESLNLESLVQSAVSTVTVRQMEKLKSEIISNISKSVKAPVKGKDYFTDAEIRAIQDKVLKKAVEETLGQVENLSSRISEVKLSVSRLTKQVQELKAMDQDHSDDVEQLLERIREINDSIAHINAITKELTGAVAVSGINLEQVSGSGSDIHASGVPAQGLTIAQFVDILAGNDQVYTGAIQDLNQVVKQLKDKDLEQDTAFGKSVRELEATLNNNGKEMDDVRLQLEKNDRDLKQQLETGDRELKQQYEQGDQELKTRLEKQNEELKQQLETEQKERKETDANLRSQSDATLELIGEKEQAGKIEGDNIFEKIGSIVRILSSDGIDGLMRVLKDTGGAGTLEEGIEHINTDLTDARVRVGELEKERWYSNLTLLAKDAPEDSKGFVCRESGSSYVYQIPLVTEGDGIDLGMDDTAVVVDFQKPDRLPSDVAFSVNGNDLLITFTSQPSRNIKIVSIHVYKEK